MVLPPTLQAITRDLDARYEHTPASLGAALRRPVSLDDVAAFVRFDPQNYVRNLVTRGERWEVRLLSWQRGQSSTLHGHGDSACAFRVLRGNAVESILGSRDRIWAPGDVVEEVGNELVHQVGNGGADTLLSLHLYSPPLPVDAPSPRQGRNVVIVGSGLAGVAVATHLLRRGDADLRISLVERGPWLGRGVAYGVDSEVFRLNVPASRMSLDPGAPDDFVEWARAEDSPHEFLPRARYGQYVVDRFRAALRGSRAKLRVSRAEAVRVERDAVVLASGVRLPAEVIVLATGLDTRSAPSSLPSDPRVVDAWDECALAALPRSGRILLLGAGLSALDVVAFLHAHSFSGHATILSRRGLLPRPHLARHSAAPPLSADLSATLPSDLRALVAWGREVVRDVERRGEPWQHAVDAIRRHIPAIWGGLSPEDRARFVRSVRPYWEVLRHRAPIDALALVDTLRARNRLETEAGSVTGCAAADDGLIVEIRRSGGRTRCERYDAIVRCTGPAIGRSEVETPLIRDLIESGRAAPDPAGLGIRTDSAGRVVGPSGEPDASLFAIGALRRASSWETTSVPDIVVHALDIAKQIAPSSS